MTRVPPPRDSSVTLHSPCSGPVHGSRPRDPAPRSIARPAGQAWTPRQRPLCSDGRVRSTAGRRQYSPGRELPIQMCPIHTTDTGLEKAMSRTKVHGHQPQLWRSPAEDMGRGGDRRRRSGGSGSPACWASSASLTVQGRCRSRWGPVGPACPRPPSAGPGTDKLQEAE